MMYICIYVYMYICIYVYMYISYESLLDATETLLERQVSHQLEELPTSTARTQGAS
jgi:hypothetical protein